MAAKKKPLEEVAAELPAAAMEIVSLELPPARAEGKITERVLTEANSSWTLPTRTDGDAGASEPEDSLGSYLLLGIDHILTGWDHLAFVLALLILGVLVVFGVEFAASRRKIQTA